MGKTVRYENIKIIKKTGTYRNYFIEFNCDKVVTKTGFLFGDTITRSNYDGYVCDRPYLISSPLDDLYKSVWSLSDAVVSEDECCLSPDIEECTTYPLHDILYAHTLDKYKVLDYDFVGVKKKQKIYGHRNISTIIIEYKQGFIKFLHEGTELKYTFDVGDKISKKVCLNCGTIDNSEEDKVIREFDSWVSSEMDKIKRKEKAKRLCEESDENT